MRRATLTATIGLMLCLARWGVAVTWDPNRFMNVQELAQILEADRKAGRPTLGVVKTILRGTEIESLEVEILSIEKNSFAQGDLIWALGVDERLRKTGTAAGMSGSPVYVQGRLIGALAYGFYNAKEPYIGVTPIEQMLRVWDRDMTPAPVSPKPSSARSAFAPILSPEEWFAALQNPHAPPQHKLPATSSKTRPEGLVLHRLSTPVASVGLPPEAQRILDATFARLGLTPVAGVGGSSPNAPDAPVQPGSVLGLEMIRGDLSLFSYGTLTYRDENRVLAFGHPLFGEGKTFLPISSGFVHFVVSSYSRSFKVAGPSRVVGTLVQDREAAIAGVLGEEHPPYVPFEVTVRSRGGQEHTYRYEILRHPDWTAPLLASAAMATFSAAEKEAGPYTMHTRLEVVFGPDASYDPLVKENLLAGGSSPGVATALLLYPLGVLLNNWFDEFPLERVRLEIDYVDGQESAVLVAARLDRSRVRPGETVVLAVTYHPYLDDPVVYRYPIQVPPDAPEGPAMLFLGDGDSYRSWERSRARERYQTTSAEKLLQQLREQGPAPQLTVALVTPMRIGISMPGSELPNLPLSMLNVLTGSTQSGEGALTQGSEIARYRFETPFLITGSTLLGLTIDSEAH